MTAKAQQTEKQEAQQAAEAPREKRKYVKQEDNSPPGQLHEAVKNYRKWYRAGDPGKADEAMQEAKEARKQLSGTTDPAQQDELMKRVRRAENRASRIRGRVGGTVHQQREALKDIQTLVEGQLSALEGE